MKIIRLGAYVLFAAMLIIPYSCQKDSDLINQEEVNLKEQLTAVTGERACGMEAHMTELLKDPVYQDRHQKKLIKIEKLPLEKANCAEKIIIPVAVHFQRIKRPDAACLIAQAEDQIRILNEDYAGTNADISLWSGDAASLFPGISNGEACIEFCLATRNHPSGYGLSEGGVAVTINETRGDSDANWAGYLNIYVRSIQYLGYSPLGGDGDGDGVVVDNNNFGSISCSGTELRADYDLGRTLTHELGHYLLLDHIWGGGCSSDDGVADTPDSNGPYYGCPANGVSSCGSTDMHMNYMDYVDDRCMYMFSAGQVVRMENYVSSTLAVFAAKAESVCGTDEPCTDCNDCVVPTGMSASVKGKNATITWDAQANTTFEVRYRIVGASTWSTKSSSTNSVVINQISKNSTYEYEVRALCGTNTTAWSATNTF